MSHGLELKSYPGKICMVALMKRKFVIAGQINAARERCVSDNPWNLKYLEVQFAIC